jgi:diacylglycerol kinase family enzyme
MFPSVYLGKHLGIREVEYFQTRRLRVETEYPLDVSAGREIADQVRGSAGGAAIIEGTIAADRGAPLKVASAHRE